MLQICTKMNGFKFDFSKIFWGGAHRAPSPDPSPRFFSGFALGSGFALNSRALRALDSGFALDTRALRALDSGFALNFRLGTLVWPPQNKFLDPPLRIAKLISQRQLPMTRPRDWDRWDHGLWGLWEHRSTELPLRWWRGELTRVYRKFEHPILTHTFQPWPLGEQAGSFTAMRGRHTIISQLFVTLTIPLLKN